MDIDGDGRRPMSMVRKRMMESATARFADVRFCQAAYHCIRVGTQSAPPMDPFSSQILEQVKLFESLEVADHHPEHRISRHIVPRLEHVEAVALYLLRELNRVCDLESFGEWTREFVTAPRPLPEAILASLGRVDHRALNRRIAPLARFFGDWESYRVARCVALLATDPARFNAIVEFARAHSGPDGRCARYVERVARLLGEASLARPPRWEWHHVETVSTALRDLGGDAHLKHLALCGYVTVECESKADCYVTLGRLHEAADHMQHEFRDWIGASRRPHYRAIHTMLEVELAEGSRAAIKVRLVPADSTTRPARMDLGRMRRILDAYKNQPGIKVFTRGMEEVSLSTGATVLDFARSVSGELVGRVQSALVNGNPVDEDHPLEAGDNVELVKLKAGDFHDLPRDWARDRSAESRAHIQMAWAINLKVVLRDRGRAWVQQRLMSLCNISMTKQAAHGVLEATLAQLCHARRKGTDPRPYLNNLSHEPGWWLAEIGKRAAELEGRTWRVPTSRLTDDDLRRLESDLRQAVESIQTRRTVPDFPPPPQRRPTFRGVRQCPCLHGQAQLGISSSRSDGVVLHALDSECASERFDVPPNSDAVEFVITAHNRVGIARDICRVFNDMEANIDAIAAKSRRGAHSVIRVRLGARHPDDDAMVSRLHDVAGVVSVFAPGGTPPAELKRFVPLIPSERRHAPTPPFTCGPPVEQPEHFYGRDRALGALHEWTGAARLSSDRGALASVRGPHRSGKSSIVLRWLQQLRAGRQPVAAAYVEATPRETWPVLHGRLMKKARQSIRALINATPHRCDPSGDDLAQLIAQMRAVPDLNDALIVFVLDEAPALMKQTTQSPEQRAAFIGFVEEVRRTPGAMLATVGPDLPFDALPPAYQALFHDINLVVVGPFAEAVTLDLISARRSDRVFPARVEREVAWRVHDWAEGDACFSTAIAYQMYQAAFDRAFGAPVFDLGAVQRAVDVVISQRGEMFVNRLRAAASHCRSAGHDSQLALEIVRSCVEDWERKRGSAMPTERLQRLRPYLTMKRMVEFAAEDAVRGVLRVLSRAGVVNRFSLSQGFFVSMTPIIAEYVSAHSTDTYRLFGAPRSGHESP